jgi:predicted site-specific integrase-resolvase
MIDINTDINNLNLNNHIINNVNEKSIIYTRVSTNNQILNRQITRCSEFCNENNFKIIGIVSESCTAYKNPVQLKLINLIHANSNINLIIEESDRLSRNLNYALKILNSCFEKNITIYILNKKYIIKNKESDDYNKLINDIKEAQNESIKKGDRIKFIKSLQKPNQQLTLLILKLYFGSYKKDIENLILKIKGSPLITNLDNIILYGNYDEYDIANIINENKILNYKKIWTKSAIKNVIKNNIYHKENTEKLTNELLIEIYKRLNNNIPDYNKIFILLTKIHNYNLSYIIVKLKELLSYNIVTKKIIWNEFLNKYNINFRKWNYEKELNKFGYNNI